jgi:UDP-3-O-[3-hydroxymyristoyl] glucosamine N-acyltransferase
MKNSTVQKEYTLTELTQGLSVEIQGNANTLIKGICTIQQAQSGHITFLTNPLYRKFLVGTQAAAVILSPEDSKECAIPAIISTNPYYVYARIAAYYDNRPKAAPGIHPSAVIGENCQIASSVSIGANSVIGNNVVLAESVTIGAGCVIGDFSEIDQGSQLDANVTLYHHIKLGKRVIIASGTVIGSDGFGLAKNKGAWCKIPQLGTVIIGDDVEIGAQCGIDRGAIENTIIENGVKLDNLIQVGHNVYIGENTAVAGCVGIAGSAYIGKNCMVGGGAGIGGHITIADNVVITGMTAVTKSIREAGVYSSGVGGLTTNMEWRKNSARLHRLDQLLERVKALEAVLASQSQS